MDLQTAMRERHSVRSYFDKPIPPDVIAQLQEEIDACNREGLLSIRLFTEEPRAFDSFTARYGQFQGVRNYLMMSGKKASDLEERVGYYGQRIVLKATTLGLQSCWVGLTYNKRAVKRHLGSDEKLVCAIALGYGTTQGTAHKNKDISTRYKLPADKAAPAWFMAGMEAAMLAPTAVNQQRFIFWLEDDIYVRAESTGGSYSRVDLGIAKYQFELGAGSANFTWRASKF